MNSFGNKFRISIFGESHGECAGVTIDGCPAGLSLKVEDLLYDLERRKGGKQKGTTIIGRMERIRLLGANHTKSIPKSILNLTDDIPSEEAFTKENKEKGNNSDNLLGLEFTD